MPKSLTVSYDLLLPESVSVPSLTPTKSQSIAIKDSESPAGYYGSLREAILQAKDILGSDLTAWRDAVGSLEQSKESKRVAKEDDEEDIDGEEEE
ncbi:hypothetical protein HWV62_7326 [Athelia sp. TMB]|nr:hypothetical protein HWV62_15849 [Athelia sp. TMB]KAF7976173.1 hypothetical protein HWV62_7326 [Athelia sp. TMB]